MSEFKDISPATINEWVTELVKSPHEYVNDKKGEYHGRIRRRLDELENQIPRLIEAAAGLRSQNKMRTLTDHLHEKIDEVHGYLDELKVADIGKWEELHANIDGSLEYIKKHLGKIGLLLGSFSRPSLD